MYRLFAFYSGVVLLEGCEEYKPCIFPFLIPRATPRHLPLSMFFLVQILPNCRHCHQVQRHPITGILPLPPPTLEAQRRYAEFELIQSVPSRIPTQPQVCCFVYPRNISRFSSSCYPPPPLPSKLNRAMIYALDSPSCNHCASSKAPFLF